MKKFISFFVGIIAILVCLFMMMVKLNDHPQASHEVLTIYNWGDYIDPELIEQFEKETGYKVNYETFDSNEAMFTKIRQGGTHYDIAIPSDYMIQKMTAEHLLQPLDHRKIKGMSALNPMLLNKPFDPHNQYSIPYFFGTLGIVYNQKTLPKGVNIQSWADLWNPKLENSIMLVDGAREVMGLALKANHQSLNSKNKEALQQAYQRLTTLVPNVKAIVADEMKMYMKQGESSVAVTFSGEARDMMEHNPNLRYIIPSEGSNLWFDNMVIPKTATNIDGAYAFINFMLRPKNAAKNAEYIGYATPNQKAMAYLPKKVTQNQAFYPDKKMMAKLEVFENLGPYYLGLYNDYFLKFKMHTH